MLWDSTLSTSHHKQNYVGKQVIIRNKAPHQMNQKQMASNQGGQMSAADNRGG